VTEAEGAAGGAPVRVEGRDELGVATVTWYFPVEVEVRAVDAPIDAEALVERTLDRLADGLTGTA
jgi:hypothetical protein